VKVPRRALDQAAGEGDFFPIGEPIPRDAASVAGRLCLRGGRPWATNVTMDACARAIGDPVRWPRVQDHDRSNHPGLVLPDEQGVLDRADAEGNIDPTGPQQDGVVGERVPEPVLARDQAGAVGGNHRGRKVSVRQDPEAPGGPPPACVGFPAASRPASRCSAGCRGCRRSS
jgi:hypothetical protein